MIDFLSRLIRFFEQYNIQYMLSGSVAMSIYVLPRSTKDFDFVVHLKSTDTLQHIYDLQLKIWLSKTPGERLLQFLQDNDAMQQALKKAKIDLQLPDTVTNFPPLTQ